MLLCHMGGPEVPMPRMDVCHRWTCKDAGVPGLLQAIYGSFPKLGYTNIDPQIL